MRKFKRSKINRFICILLCVVLNLFPLNYLNVPKISAQGSGLKISILEVKDASGSARPWGKTATTSLTLSLMKYFEVVDRSKLLSAMESTLNKKVTDEEISTLDRAQVLSAARAIGIDVVVYGRLLRAQIVKIKDIGEAQVVVEFYDTKKGHIINRSSVAVTTSERVGYSGAKELIIEEAITSASDLASSEAKKNYDLSLEGGRIMGVRQKGEEKIVLCDIAEGKIKKGGQLLVRRNGDIIGTLEVIKLSRTYSEAQELTSVKEIKTGDNLAVLSNSPLVRKGYTKIIVEGKDTYQEAKPKKKSSLTKILIGAAVLGGIAYVATQKKDKKQQTVDVTIGMPPAVANVKARPIELSEGRYGVEVTWDKVTSDSTVVYYNVYRWESALGESSKVKIADIEAKEEGKYIDGLPDTLKQKVLEPTKQYSYKVTAVNNKGTEGTQPSKDPVTGATITGVAKDPTTGDETIRPDTYQPKPLAPEEVRVVSWGRNISLSWKKVTRDERGEIPETDLKVSYKVARETTTPPAKIIKEGIVQSCSTDTGRICWTDEIKDISDDANVYYAVKAVHPQYYTESDPSSPSLIRVGSFPANVSINLSIDKPKIAANGESTAKLTAVVKELRFNTPAPDGVEVKFTTDSGAIDVGKRTEQGEASKTYTARTLQGIATATLTSSLQVGIAKIKAEIIYNSRIQGLPDEKEIQFVGGTVEIVVIPLRIPADGQTFATITAVIKDANGGYIKDGTEVQWTTTHGYIKEPLQTTKGGKVQITIISDVCAPCQDATVCKPEVRQVPATITATIPAQGAEKSVEITFTCLNISLTTPSTILANGTSTSTIRAEVRDEVGNFVPDGTVVYFKATATDGRILSIDNQILTKNGIANATLKSIESSNSLDVTVEATAGGKAFTKIVKLEPPEVGSITPYADPQITAPGKYLKIKAVVKDTQNYPLKNREITFTVLEATKLVGGMVSSSDIEFFGYGSAVSSIKINTDSQGIAEASLTIRVPSNATVRVTSAPKIAQVTVKYAAISLENLSAIPNSILANGRDQSTVSVRVIDMTKSPIEPLSGARVRFTTNKGVLIQSIVTTTAGGFATTSLVADTYPGEATITASIPCSENLGTYVCDDNYKEVVRVALTILGPSQITFSADPKSVLANGSSTIELTARLIDTNGNPVIDGTNVFFVSSDEKLVISPYYSDSYKNVGKVTTKNGAASTTLRSSTTAQSVLIRVFWWDDPSNLSLLGMGKDTYFDPLPDGAFLIQTSDRVELIGGPVANISMAFNELNIPGWDYLGVETKVTIYLSDSNNNAVKDGTEVRFTATCGIIEALTEYKKSDGCTGCGYTKDSKVEARYRSSRVADDLNCPLVDGKAGYAQIVVTSSDRSAEEKIILSGTPHSIQLTATSSIPSGGRTQIIAKVYDINGNPVSLKDPFGNPRKVTFSSREGTLSPIEVNLSGTHYDTNIATTDYTAPTIPVGETKIDTITTSAGPGVSMSRNISISGEAGVNYQITYIISDLYPITPEIDLTADGISNVEIAAIVRDLGNIIGGNPAPVAGVKVDFTTTSGTITPFAVTNQNGQANARLVSDTKVGMATVTISVDNVKEQFFVFFIPGRPDKLTLTIEQERIKVGSATVVKVDVRDRSGNKVQDGTEIAFLVDATSSGNGTLISYEGTNISRTVNGFASCTFSGTIPGYVRIVAEYVETNYRRDTSGILTVIGDPNRISLTAEPMRIPADGVSRTTIIARVIDIRNTPVADGTVIEFEATPSDNVFTTGAPIFSALTTQGEARAVLISSRRVPDNLSGAATITARYSPLNISSTTDVYLDAGAPDRVRIVADRNPARITADGLSQMEIYAIVEDRYRNPVKEGTDITFNKMPSGLDTGMFLPDATVKTRNGVNVDLNYNSVIEDNERDLKGVAQIILLTSRKTGSVYIYCTAPSNPYSPTLKIDFLPGEAEQVIVSANPPTILATNNPALPSQTTITAEVRDGNNNLVPSGNVTFTYSGTAGAVFNDTITITTTLPITAGKATATLNAPQSIGRGQVKAQIGTAFSEVNLSFIPSRVNIIVSAAPSTVLTNGYDFSEISAIITDAGTQSMVTGVVVLFGVESGEGILSSSEGITSSAEDIAIRGRAYIRFISKKSNSLVSSSARVRATIAGAEVVNTDNYVDITLEPYRPRPVEWSEARGRNSLVELAWYMNPTTDLVVAYQIEKNPGGVLITPSPPTAITYIDSAVVNGTTYTYRVRAQSENTRWSEWSSPRTAVPIAPAPPGAPDNVRVVGKNEKVILNWSPAQRGDEDITLYRIYRSLGVDPGVRMPDIGTFVNITPQGIPQINNFYEDLGVEKVPPYLVNNRVYYYYMTSVDRLGQESARSTIVFAMPIATLATPPAAPRWASTNAVIPEDISLTLNWQKVISDVTGVAISDSDLIPVVEYNIYRSISDTFAGGAHGNYQLLTTVSAPQLSYVDTALTPNWFYFYKVSAVREGGDSGEVEGPKSDYAYGQVGQPAIVLYSPAKSAWLVADITSQTEDKDEYRWFKDRGVEHLWSPVKGATRYIVEASRDPNMVSLEKNIVASGTSTTITWDTSLPGGQSAKFELWWRVKAISDDYTAMAISETRHFTLATYANQTCDTIPSVPTNFSATAGQELVNLSWTTNPPADNVVEYWIYRAEGMVSSYILLTKTQASSYTDTTAHGGTLYGYRISAVNDCSRESAQTQPAKFATPTSAPLSLPSIVTGTNAVSCDSMVRLSWNPNSSQEKVTNYRISRSDDGGNTYSDIYNTNSSTVREWTNTGLVNGRTYYYKIRAQNATGFSSDASIKIATPSGIPSPVKDFAGVPGDTNISLSWNIAGAEEDIISYYLYISTEASNVSSTPVESTDRCGNTLTSYNISPPANMVYTAVVSKNTNTYTMSKFYDNRVGQTPPYYLRDRLANGTPYYLTIQPVTYTGRGMPISPIEVTPTGTAPAPSWSAFTSCPNGRCDTYISGTTAYLRWLPVWSVFENNNITYLGDIVGYNIYRNGSKIIDKESGILLQVENNGVLEYIDRDLTVGATYNYTIRAVRAGDTEGTSSSTKTLVAFSTTIPAAPTGFTATAGDAQATVSWNANIETDLTGYRLYWSLSSADLNNLASPPISVAVITRPITAPFNYTVTTYKDAEGVERQGLLNGTPYYFRLTARNPVGESTPTSIISATPMPANITITVSVDPQTISANAISSATITARIVDATTNQAVADGTRVVFSATGGTVYPISAITTGGYATTNIRSSKITLPPDEQNITVTARVGSISSNTNLKFKAYAPPPPENLQITAGNQVITLLWDTLPSSDLVTGYKIYRAVGDPPGAFSEVASIPGTSYLDSGLTNGERYNYKVSAVNEYGEGAQSQIVFAIPLESAQARPSTPQGLTATPGYYRVTLRWNANPEQDLYKYIVYWASTNSPVVDPASLGWTPISSLIPPSDTQYIHTELTNNLIYYYYIIAVNTQLLQSNSSNFVHAVPSASAPPAKPQWVQDRPAVPVDGNVVGNQIIGASVILNWQPVTQDVGGQLANVMKYKIWVATRANGIYTEAGQTDVPFVTWTYTFNSDAGELRPTRYFKITALNSENQESPFSDEIYATVNIPTLELLSPQNGTTVLPNANILLYWSEVRGATIYYVEQARQYDPSCTKEGDDGILGTSDDVQGCLYGYYSNAQAGGISAPIITISQDPTVVYWRVTAKSDPARTIATSYVWKYTITSSLIPPTDLSTPTNLVANGGDGIITLNWTANPPGENVIGYHIYWGLTPDNLLDITEPLRNKGHAVINTNSYVIRHYYDAKPVIRNSLPNGTRFYIQVTAIAQYGQVTFESVPSQIVSASPVGGPPPAPLWAGAPGDGCTHPPYIEGTIAFVNWRPVWAEVTNNIATYIGDITGYNVYRNDVLRAGPIPGAPIPACNIGSIQYIDSGLTSGQTYKYEVSAISQSAGEGAESIPLYLTAYNNTPPTPPTGFNATAQNGNVQLSWIDNPEADVIAYRIFWALNPDDILQINVPQEDRYVDILGPTALSADVGGNTTNYLVNRFVDSQWREHNFLANGTPYYFRLQAMNQARKSNPTLTISVVPTGPPPAPQWSTVVDAEYGVQGTTARIRWIPVWDDNLTDSAINYIGDLQTYRIYRNGNPLTSTLGDVVSGVGYDVLQYLDSGLAPGSYQYYIVAVSATGGDSDPSLTKTLTVVADPAPPAAPIITNATAGNRQITVTFNHPNEAGDNVAMYEVHRGVDFSSLTPIAAVPSTGASPYTYTISSLDNNVAYYVRIRAINDVSEESDFSNIVSATPQYNVVPAAPDNIIVTEGNSQLTVEWNASQEYEFVTSYQIWRATGENPLPGDFTQIAGAPVPPTAVFYIDTNVVNGTKYTYKIIAANSTGDSNFSAPASGRPQQELVNIPRIPTGLTATPGYFRITLNWTASTEPDMLGYRIHYATTTDSTLDPSTLVWTTLPAMVDRINTQFIHLGLTNTNIYYYRISAVNTALLESERTNFVSAIPQASGTPEAPSWLLQNAVSVVDGTLNDNGTPADPSDDTIVDAKVILNWQSVVRDISGAPINNVVRYEVFVSKTETGVYTKELQDVLVPLTTYTHTFTSDAGDLRPVRYYKLKAITSENLISNFSEIRFGRPNTPISQPPRAPVWPDPASGTKAATPVQGTVAGNQILGAKIILEWLPVTQDITGGQATISKYKIYVSRQANGVYDEIGEAYYPSVTYIHTFDSDAGELRPTRFYRVRAINQEGLFSNYSREIYATINIPTLELLSPQNDTTIAFSAQVAVSLHWSPVDNASMYYVEQAGIYDPTCTKVGDDGLPNTPDDIQGCFYRYYSNALSGSTNYTSTITATVDPTVVYWRVTAKSVENRTIATSKVWKYIITDRVGECGNPVIPSKPQNLTLTSGDGIIIADWDANPVGENIVSYRVYWSTSPVDVLSPNQEGDGSAYVNIDAHTIRNYYDATGTPRNSLPNGTTFYIQVTAITKYPNCDITAFEGFPSEMKSEKPQGGAPPAPLWAGAPGTGCGHPSSIEGTTALLHWRPVWAEVSGNTVTYIGDIIGYNIYRDDVQIAGPIPGFPVPACDIGSLEYIVAGLTGGQTYNFQVSAVSESAGEGTLSVPLYLLAVDNTLPSPPQNFAAATDNQKINLTWDANPPQDNVVGYRIWWALDLDDLSQIHVPQQGGGFADFPGPTALYSDVGASATAYTVNRYIDADGVQHNFLANGTPYFFRLQAVNPAGKSQPTNIISETPVGAPPAPRWSTVVNAEYGVDGTTAQIRWLPVWDDNLTDATINYIGDLQEYRIYRGGAQIAATLGDRVSGVSYDVLEYLDSGLAVGSYDYYLTAFSASGNEGAQSLTKTLVIVADPVPPAAPTITLTTPGNQRVTIQWTHPAEVGDNIAIYEIYGGTTTQLDSLPFIKALSVSQYPQPGTYTVTELDGQPLVNNTSYYFRMQAVNQSGARSAFSNVMAAIPQYGLPPASPTGLTAEAGNSVVYLSWLRAPSYEGVTSCELWRAAGDPPGAFALTATVTPSPTQETIINYTNVGVTNGTKYTYYVRAVNSTGTSLESPRVFAIPSTGLQPTIPRDFGSVTGNNKVNLSWTANTEEDLAGYRIYRSGALNVGDPPPLVFPYANVYTISEVDTTYEDITVVNDSVYYYYITAYNDSGQESSRSGITMAMPRAVTSIPPLAPEWTEQRAVVAGKTKITINWLPVRQNVLQEEILALTPVVKYRVYREVTTSYDEGAYGDYNDFPAPDFYIEVDSPAISYTDPCPACGLLVNNEYYFYKVSAVLSDGTEGQKSTYVFGQIEQPTIVLFAPPTGAWIVADFTREEITSGDTIRIVYSYTANVNFAWSRVEGASRYLLELSRDAGMVSINKSIIIGQSDSPAYTQPWEWPDVAEGTALKEDFFWRVTALSDLYIATAVSKVIPLTIASYNNPACATVPGYPITSPAVPGINQVTLDWDEPTTNYDGTPITGSIVGYKIYRACNSSGPYGSLRELDASTTDYIDSAFTPTPPDPCPQGAGYPYYYTFTAINTCGRESSMSLPVRMAIPQEPALQPPSIVAGTTVTTCDNNTILAWRENPTSEKVTSYKVYSSTDPGALVEIWSGNALTYTNIGLTRGLTYYYKVTAVNTAGESDLVASTLRSATPIGIPSAPTNFTATAADGRIDLSWDNLSLTEQDVIGYYIYWAADPLNPMDMQPTEEIVPGIPAACGITLTRYVINQRGRDNEYATPVIYRQAVPKDDTTYTARVYYDVRIGSTTYPLRTRLANGTPYYFTIQAITPRGEGAIHSFQSVTPQGQPPQVQWSTATGEASETDSLNVTLRWKPVWYETDAGVITYIGDIEGYKIYRDDVEIVQVMGTQMANRVVLEWGETVSVPAIYKYNIYAVSTTGGDSPISADLNLNVTFTAQPSAPTITSQTSGNRTITINWTHPNEAGESISAYVIRAGQEIDNIEQLQEVAAVNAGTFTYIITRIGGQEPTNGTHYYVRMVAVNSAGQQSELSNPIVGIPRDNTKPSIPTWDPVRPITPLDGTVELRWNANDAQEQITHYRIYRADIGDTPYREVSSAVRYYSDGEEDWGAPGTPLTNGTNYCYKITARRATPAPALESDKSTFVCERPRKTTPPALAENPDAIAGNRLVQISFEPAPETDIVNYTIYRGTTSGGPWTAVATLQHMPGVLNYQYNDQYREPDNLILNGTRYYYYITVRNLADLTSDTAVFPDIGVMPSGGRPSIPSNFTATSGDSQIVLRWAARPQPDEEQLTQYVLMKDDGTGTFPITLFTVLVNDPPADCYFEPVVQGYTNGRWTCVDTGVINGTTYFYKMRARNTPGPGPFTNVVYARAQSSRPPAPPEWATTVPIAAGNRRITIKWEAASVEPDLQGYYLEWSSDGATFVRFASVGLGLRDPADGDRITYIDTGQNIQGYTARNLPNQELINGTKYYYRIVAYNFTYRDPNNQALGFLESDASTIKSATPQPTAAPTAPPDTTASPFTLTSGDRFISLSWNENPQQEAVIDYKIERNFADNCGGNNETNYCEIPPNLTVRNFVNIADDNPDFPVINGRNYTFKVYARNVVGLGPPQIVNCRTKGAIPVSASLPATPAWDVTPAPDRPVMLVASSGANTSKVGLAFESSASADVWGYYIFRSTSQTGTYGFRGEIASYLLPISEGFDWVDENANAGQVYYYKIAAVGMTSSGIRSGQNPVLDMTREQTGGRLSELSEARPITDPTDGVIPFVDVMPDAPRNPVDPNGPSLTVQRIGSAARLEWYRVDGTSTTDILGYYMYRATKPYPWDGVLPADVDYSRLQSGGVDIIVPQPTGNLIYTNSGLTYDTTAYFYKVSAIRARGTGATSQYPPVPGQESARSNMATPSLTAPPDRPEWCTATPCPTAERPVVPFMDDLGMNAVQLTWIQPPTWGNIAGYKVYRSGGMVPPPGNEAQGPYELIGTVPIGFTPNNQFVDDDEGGGLLEAANYFYCLKAYDVNGNESPYSDYIFAQVGLDDIILYTPENEQTIVIPTATTTNVMFEWSPVRLAGKYLIQVSSADDPNFDNQIYGYTTVVSDGGIMSQIYSGLTGGGGPQPLEAGITYYWKVKAYDAHNNLLLTSPTNRFTLVTP